MPIGQSHGSPRNGVVSSLLYRGAVNEVANVRGVGSCRKCGARHMLVWLDALGMVDRIPRLIQRSSIRQVAHIVLEVCPRERGAWRVPIGLDGLRMVDAVASSVQRCAIWQIPHVIPELQVCVGIALIAIGVPRGVPQDTWHGDSADHSWGTVSYLKLLRPIVGV